MMSSKTMEDEKKKNSKISERQRALHWQVMRMALLWVRKGGAFRRRLMVDLRLILDYLKTLHLGGHHHRHHKEQQQRKLLVPYRLYEREMSFDETPIFRFKKNKPCFPCIDLHSLSSVDGGDDCHRLSFMSYSSSTYDHQTEQDEDNYDNDEEQSVAAAISGINLEMEGDQTGGGEIDDMAEEFIRKFHQQMKLQRQISLLRYNDIHQRSIT